TALAAAFIADRTAAILSTGAQALVNSGLVAGTARMLGYSTATATATTQASAFRTGQSAVASALGGPLIAALSLAGTAIIGFYAAEQQQKQKVAGLATSLSGLGDEYQRTGHV